VAGVSGLGNGKYLHTNYVKVLHRHNLRIELSESVCKYVRMYLLGSIRIIFFLVNLSLSLSLQEFNDTGLSVPSLKEIGFLLPFQIAQTVSP